MCLSAVYVPAICCADLGVQIKDKLFAILRCSWNLAWQPLGGPSQLPFQRTSQKQVQPPCSGPQQLAAPNSCTGTDLHTT